MAVSFETEALLRVVDQATPQMERVLALSRELAVSFERLRGLGTNLFSGTRVTELAAGLGKVDPALMKATGSMERFNAATITGFNEINAAAEVTTERLAAVTLSAQAAAAAAIAGAERSTAAATAIEAGILRGAVVRPPASVVPGAPGGRGGGRGGGGAFHAAVPMDIGGVRGQARLGGGVGMATGLAAAYGIYEDVNLQDVIVRALYTAQAPNSPENVARLRDIITKASIRTGMGLTETGEAAHAIIRNMAPFSLKERESVIAPIIDAAALETRLKPEGGNLEQNTDALVQILHQASLYKPKEMRDAITAFTYASLYDPMRVSQMATAASYTIPIATKIAHVNASSVMELVAMMQSAGFKGKSGTWLEAAIEGLLPGTRVFSGKAYEKQLEWQKKIGLVDAAGRTTITDSSGQMNVLLGFKKVMEYMATLTPQQRTREAEMFASLGGKTGARALAFFTDDTVFQRIADIQKGSEQFAKTYELFLSQYGNQSTKQAARVGISEFTVAAAQLGDIVMPALTVAIKSVTGVAMILSDVFTGMAKVMGWVAAQAPKHDATGARIDAQRDEEFSRNKSLLHNFLTNIGFFPDTNRVPWIHNYAAAESASKHPFSWAGSSSVLDHSVSISAIKEAFSGTKVMLDKRVVGSVVMNSATSAAAYGPSSGPGGTPSMIPAHP